MIAVRGADANNVEELIINGDELNQLREQAREWMGEAFTTDEGLPAFVVRRLFGLASQAGEAKVSDQITHVFPEEDLASMVFQIGGAAIGVAMQDHPDYIMPSERVSEAILRVMKDLGHDISNVPGYRPNKATSILQSMTTEVQG